MILTIMCGLPGSGKSKISKRIAIENKNTMVISKDSIREMVFCEYKFDVNFEVLVNDIQNRLIREYAERGLNIIIDNTNLKAKDRKQIVNYVKNNSCEFVNAKIIYCHSDNSLRNRMEDNKGIDNSIWRKVHGEMSRVIETPTEKECDELEEYYNFVSVKAIK